jgi:hypothetical protein
MATPRNHFFLFEHYFWQHRLLRDPRRFGRVFGGSVSDDVTVV